MYKNRHKPAVCPKCGCELAQKSTKEKNVRAEMGFFFWGGWCIESQSFSEALIFSFSVCVFAGPVSAPHSFSKGYPAEEYATVATTVPSDPWEWRWAPGNSDPHPGTQQSSDCPGSVRWSAARVHCREWDVGGVWVASLLWMCSYTLRLVHVSSLQRRPKVRRRIMRWLAVD